RGHPELANVVFNRYFDRTAEVAGAEALPLFLSMHAAIRAHVGAIAVPGAEAVKQKEPRMAEARAYLGLAGDLLGSGQALRLIAIGGLSGTGKSTLAHGLAPQIAGVPGARVLRSDVLRKRLKGVPPEMPLPPSAYGEQTSREVYALMVDEAARLLAGGQ